jgi:hypothetical protein
MKERLDMHQGQLIIQTQPGEGCEIIVEIPRRSPQVAPTITPSIGPWVSFSLDTWYHL